MDIMVFKLLPASDYLCCIQIINIIKSVSVQYPRINKYSRKYQHCHFSCVTSSLVTTSSDGQLIQMEC